MERHTDKTEPDFGKYEKRLLILLLFSAIPNAFSALQFLSTHYTPNYYCSEGEGEIQIVKNNASLTDLRNQSFVQAGSNESDWNANACLLRNSSFGAVNGSQKSEACKKFHFEGKLHTVISEFEMVCDKAWLKPMLTSFYMVGKMIGAMLGGFVSDRYGRRFGFLLFTVLQFVLSLVTSFATNIPMYGVFLTMAGVCSIANFEITVVIGSEMMSIKRRGLAFLCCEMGFSIGYMILALLTYLFVSWRWFLIFTGLFGVLYIPYYWLIDETPTWLLATGQRERAKEVLMKIAKYNGQECNSAASLSLIEAKLSQKEASATIWSTFAQMKTECYLIARLIVVLFSWCIASLTYYTITLNNDNWSGNRYINIFIGSLTEFFSSFLYYFGVTQLGRQKSYMGFMIFSSVAVASAPFLAKWNGIYAMVASMLAKLTVNVAYNVLYPYNNELFPTNIRTTVLAFSSAASRIGSMIAPFVIFAGESGDTMAPSIGMAVMIFASALSYLFLPETKNAKLPQTLEEAKNLNRASTTYTGESKDI